MDQDTFFDLRRRIGAVNRGILELLSERGRLVMEIGRMKLDADLKMYDPEREAEMIAELAAANAGPYPDEAVALIFKAIFQMGVDLMAKKRK